MGRLICDQNIFFTSDIHFNHTNILIYDKRPWSSIEDMNEGIVENWNKKVQDDSAIVFIIGDVALGSKSRAGYIAGLLGRMRGNKYLIKGNHDHFVTKPPCEDHFIKICNYLEIIVEDPESLDGTGQQVIEMQHYPPKEDYKPEWGRFLLHGHSHHNLHHGEAKNPYPFQLDVGINGPGYNYSPLSYQDVMNLVRQNKERK